jgi:FG-GAP repeat protein
MFHSWYRRFVKKARPCGRQVGPRATLTLEALEERAVPSFSGAQNYPTLGATGGAPLAVATGDFNGDGLADLAVADSVFGGPGSVTVFLNNPLR